MLSVTFGGWVPLDSPWHERCANGHPQAECRSEDRWHNLTPAADRCGWGTWGHNQLLSEVGFLWRKVNEVEGRTFRMIIFVGQDCVYDLLYILFNFTCFFNITYWCFLHEYFYLFWFGFAGFNSWRHPFSVLFSRGDAQRMEKRQATRAGLVWPRATYWSFLTQVGTTLKQVSSFWPSR